MSDRSGTHAAHGSPAYLATAVDGITLNAKGSRGTFTGKEAGPDLDAKTGRLGLDVSVGGLRHLRVATHCSAAKVANMHL